MKFSTIMQPMRRTMLVMVLAAMQLAACGGSSNDHEIAKTTASNGGLALSTTPSTGYNSTVDSSIAPPTSATGSLKLNWTPPVSRTDGSPLLPSDIDGFHIYYGKKPDSYPSQINVADGTAQSITVTNIATGVYYLVMTTYDVNGRESGYSPVITKTVL